MRYLTLTITMANAERIGALLSEQQGNTPENDEFFMAVIGAQMAPIREMTRAEAGEITVPRNIEVVR